MQMYVKQSMIAFANMSKPMGALPADMQWEVRRNYQSQSEAAKKSFPITRVSLLFEKEGREGGSRGSFPPHLLYNLLLLMTLRWERENGNERFELCFGIIVYIIAALGNISFTESFAGG